MKKEEAMIPSFSFESLKKEIQNLVNSVELPTENLTTNEPTFIFGCLKNNSKNKHLLTCLEKTQKKIQTFLKSENFFKEVSCFIDIKETDEHFTDQEKLHLAKIIAYDLCQQLNQTNRDVSSFFEGMAEAEKNLPSKFSLVDSRRLLRLRSLCQASKNFKAYDELFDKF